MYAGTVGFIYHYGYVYHDNDSRDAKNDTDPHEKCGNLFRAGPSVDEDSSPRDTVHHIPKKIKCKKITFKTRVEPLVQSVEIQKQSIHILCKNCCNRQPRKREQIILLWIAAGRIPHCNPIARKRTLLNPRLSPQKCVTKCAAFSTP